MTDAQITREDTGNGAARYVARLEGQEAELTTQRDGDTVIADHTNVPPQFEGRGIGTALVKALVADARAQGFRIVPQCPFVAAQAKRHPEWAELFVMR